VVNKDEYINFLCKLIIFYTGIGQYKDV